MSLFRDRAQAGEMLAKQLAAYAGQDAVVLALPRGGVAVAEPIARRLGLPLDSIVVRKVGHPDDPEYALCAVDAAGASLCEREASEADEVWMREAVKHAQAEAARRLALYRSGRKPIVLQGKTAIIIDDGVATGLSMRLAIRVVRALCPARIIVAVPVSSEEAAAHIKREADDLILLDPPSEFLGAIGMHYERFEQVSDAEVMRLLGRQ